MNNKILLVANWKANNVDIKKWLSEFNISDNVWEKIEVTIAGSYPLIPLITDAVKSHNLPISLSSQDLSMYQPGSYTGEVPAVLLKNMGIKYSLLGHSERRKNVRETNIEIEAKLAQAINNEIIPIICAQTLEEIPNNIRNYDSSKYLVMYEPSSAISTNGQYHPDSVENIQSTLSEWQKKLPVGISFLYGGSVNLESVQSFQPLLIAGPSSAPLLSGFVIGHASLEASSFSEIIKTLCGLPN